MPRIFISYRRSDDPFATHSIYRELASHFGRESMFMDVDDIPVGADFVEHLDGEVGRCDIVVAVIGDRWLDLLDENRRSGRPDFVEVEIASALTRGIPVVPVLVGNARMPEEARLPQSLKKLARRNAAEVRPGRDLEAHLGRLIRGIERLTEGLQQVCAPVEGVTAAVEATPAAKAPPEMLSFPLTAEQAKEYQRRWAEHLGLPVETTNSVGMKFAFIPPGAFLMGSPEREESRRSDERQHKVTLTKGFYMGVTPVTQAQWKSVTGRNPSHFKGANRPVEKVSWEDTLKFIQELSRQNGKRYALPTEAQWEYACRAGTTTPFYFGETISTEQVNYDGNHAYGVGEIGEYRGETMPVGRFPPNAWGLYEMHGNVLEWCMDWYAEYPRVSVKDYGGPQTGEYRILRGGSWQYNPKGCRSAFRSRHGPAGRNNNIGLRLALRLD